MAPVKVPKNPMKPVEKVIEKPRVKSKKTKKKNYQSFAIYLFRILRTIAKGNIGMSSNSMIIMDNFVTDMFEKLAAEAGRFVSHGNKRSITSFDVQATVKLLIPGELATQANIESTKAVAMCYKSKEKDVSNKP